MQIIVTIQNLNKRFDFQLNSEMRIKDALVIINENSGLTIDANRQYIYSSRDQKMIPTTYTFKDARIFSGDILIMEGKKNG